MGQHTTDRFQYYTIFGKAQGTLVFNSLIYIQLHFATTKCVPVHFLIKLRFSPTQYLKNASCGTSLAFQMREEYCFKTFFSFKI